MIKNVIFDVDGTLVDSNKLHAESWQKAFAKYDKQIEFDAILPEIGKGGDQLMPEFLSPAEMAKFGEELEEYRNELFQKEYLSKVKPFPKVRELFERIKQNGGCVIFASSATDKDVEEFKKITNTADLLEDATSSDDADSSKPEPDIFLAALEKLGNPPKEETVVVGDTPYDAIAAKKAGLQTVGVTCGGWSAEDLKKAGCIEVYESPADLLEKYDESLLAKGAAQAAN
jgi:HAD superfamily hydrolase (TIGR01549 family)